MITASLQQLTGPYTCPACDKPAQTCVWFLDDAKGTRWAICYDCGGTEQKVRAAIVKILTALEHLKNEPLIIQGLRSENITVAAAEAAKTVN